MTIIRTGSRLHFGLFDVRRFGGVGMMIEEPAVEVSVQLADQWQVDGALQCRSQFVVERLAAVPQLPSMHIRVLRAPSEHVGLGVGTQISLALGAAIMAEAEIECSHVTLAKMLQRGQRSAIGVHGFQSGGFLMDAGPTADNRLAPLIARTDVSSHWHILLVTPNTPPVWSGDRERDAFAKLSDQPYESTYDSMRHFAESALAPEVEAGDLVAFGAALTEFNAKAGELFTSVQAGRYVTSAVADLVDQLTTFGLTGVGQTSWGPTVFAFADDVGQLSHVVRRLEGEDVTVRITRARGRGAHIRQELLAR